MPEEVRARIIKEELLLMPNGDRAQQMFRAMYEKRRLHDLAFNEPPRPAGDILREAASDVRRHYAGFLPVVTDSAYFELRPGQCHIRAQ